MNMLLSLASNPFKVASILLLTLSGYLYTVNLKLERDNVVLKSNTITLESSIKEQYGIETDNDALTLPVAYWIPKMHKNPIGSRFIIASKNCVTKKLSKNITSAFKLIQKSLEST